jgi:hypothetical protein
MSYLNTYQRSPATFAPDAHLTTPPETYDYNFVFPVKLLSSDRVELRPFVVSGRKSHVTSSSRSVVTHSTS